MRKIVISILVCLFAFALTASAQDIYYDFENDGGTTVTNTLGNGGNALYTEGFEGKGLELNGSYGLHLGDVTNTYSVSAMVKITSSGSTDTIFFKNMGNASAQKWTGVQSRAGKAAVWSHGDAGLSWSTAVEDDMASLASWAQIVYTEDSGTGTLYVNGEKIGSGKVVQGAGSLYLGATYWSGDAPTGVIDNLSVVDKVLSAEEVSSMYDACAERLLNIPSEVVGDIELPEKLGSKAIAWKTSDSGVITETGRVTRADEDKTAVLTAVIDGKEIPFTVKVLKKPVIVNDKVILSYTFKEDDKDVIHDRSGNGNHAMTFGELKVDKNGAFFDGTDDYVKMPEGVINGHDNITIIFDAVPQKAQEHIFAYVFGNSSNDGYIFLNTSRPTTNALRFAATMAGSGEEKDTASVPGIRKNEEGVVVVTIDGTFASMYLDGELVMDGDLGMKVSDLGETKANYIAKSLYEGDGYFKGYVKEFTVYNYVMDAETIKASYAKTPEYINEEQEEYITSLSFENGITAELDTFGRDDVYIAVLSVDEEGHTLDYSIAQDPAELKEVKGDSILVFAFNKENNIPGKVYVKQENDDAVFEYTKTGLSVFPKKTAESAAVIAAGYDAEGSLKGICVKKTDIKIGESIDFEGDFENCVKFKLISWESIESMKPIE